MSFFEPKDYLVINNLVTRISKQEIAPKEKENLLREVLSYYTGGLLPKLTDFEFIGEVDLDDLQAVNCVCSHPILHAYYIRHIGTGISFKIGSKCFENLYGKCNCDKNYFFKPPCLNCNREKVLSKRSTAGKGGFCCNKCMHIYAKKFECTDCGKRFWRNNPSHLWCKPCWRKNTFYGEIKNVGYLIR